MCDIVRFGFGPKRPRVEVVRCCGCNQTWVNSPKGGHVCSSATKTPTTQGRRS